MFERSMSRQTAKAQLAVNVTLTSPRELGGAFPITTEKGIGFNDLRVHKVYCISKVRRPKAQGKGQISYYGLKQVAIMVFICFISTCFF